jgi:hypothetical protein
MVKYGLYEIRTLLIDYINACVEHGNGTEAGNCKKTNKAYDLIDSTYKKLTHFENGKYNLL